MKIRCTKNPIISRQGVCDPHIHIFRDRAYLYASHDIQREGSTDFCMRDWEIWSSDDLISWEKESTVRPEEMALGATNQCWAVDAAQKDGVYYLYVSHGPWETWVLRSDDPGKGFTEVLGKPMLPKGLTKTFSYDPAVFTDEDGESYIVFGAPVWVNADGYYIARLQPDMVSLAEAPRKIQLDDTADDKPFIHKYNGTYYLTWASYYATSDSVYGPYTTRGNLNLSLDHGSVFSWRGQWFMAFTVDQSIDCHRRATGLAYIHYRANGEMCADPLIREYGVGQYDADWNVIEAEWYMAGQGVSKVENEFGNFDVAMQAGSWLEFPHIRNVPQDPFLCITGISEAPVELEVYEGDVLLGVVRKEASFMDGGSFTRYNVGCARLPLPAGEHSLRLRAKGPLLLNYFSLQTQ